MAKSLKLIIMVKLAKRHYVDYIECLCNLQNYIAERTKNRKKTNSPKLFHYCLFLEIISST
jgi:hypothetical protein